MCKNPVIQKFKWSELAVKLNTGNGKECGLYPKGKETPQLNDIIPIFPITFTKMHE